MLWQPPSNYMGNSLAPRDMQSPVPNPSLIIPIANNYKYLAGFIKTYFHEHSFFSSLVVPIYNQIRSNTSALRANTGPNLTLT